MGISRVSETVFDKQVRKVRETYSHRRTKMLEALEKSMPAGVEWTRPEGGMFVWVTLPAGMDGARLLETSLTSAKVAFVPGRAFHADGSGANTLRLSFSCATDEMIEQGIGKLGALASDLRRDGVENGLQSLLEDRVQMVGGAKGHRFGDDRIV
eukprot:gene49769-67581_t